MPNDGEARDETPRTDEEQVSAGEQKADQTNGSSPDDEADQSEDAAAEDAATASGGAPDPERDLARLEQEIAELKDQLLRKSADFENYRKRMQREKEEFASYANRDLLLDIVPIIDDFERAIKSAEESHDFDAFHDGIVMIEKQFTSMLERKWKLVRFDSEGEEFDPQRHEAMMTEPVPGHDHSVVLQDFQKGYLLNDRVLRPAKVKVSMPAPGGDGSDAGADQPGQQTQESAEGSASGDSSSE